MKADLDKQFREATLDTYRQAKQQYGYNATYFLQMVQKHGAVNAARRLLDSDGTYGFTKLWELGRLDLSIEAKMLRPQFAPLFTAEELAKARKKLLEYGYEPEN